MGAMSKFGLRRFLSCVIEPSQRASRLCELSLGQAAFASGRLSLGSNPRCQSGRRKALPARRCTSDSESPERQAAMTAVPKRSMQRWESGLDPRIRTGVNAGWTGGQSFRQSSRCGRHQARPISGRRKESEAHVRSASGTRRHASGPVGSGVARSRVLVQRATLVRLVPTQHPLGPMPAIQDAATARSRTGLPRRSTRRPDLGPGSWQT